jgi:hypothetical protein
MQPIEHAHGYTAAYRKAKFRAQVVRVHRGRRGGAYASRFDAVKGDTMNRECLNVGGALAESPMVMVDSHEF